MSSPCFRCGAAATCRHRTVELADRAHVADRIDGRTVGGKFLGAHGNFAGPAGEKIRRSLKEWEGRR